MFFAESFVTIESKNLVLHSLLYLVTLFLVSMLSSDD